MAIRSLLRDGIFDDRAIAILTEAFEEALRLANVSDRLSPQAEALAARIIVLFGQGEDDPEHIARIAADS